MGVSIGFFSPQNEIGPAIDDVCQRIREICGVPSIAFPFRASPVEDEGKNWPMLYATVAGHVPVHIDRPAKSQLHQAMFMFVLEAEERPVLLCSPATKEASEVIFLPDMVRAPRMMFGAIELKPGVAIHFDPTKQFHGITGYPTGDLAPSLPSCVMVQVPHKDPRDIRGAIGTMKRCFRTDDRFADLVAKKT